MNENAKKKDSWTLLKVTEVFLNFVAIVSGPVTALGMKIGGHDWTAAGMGGILAAIVTLSGSEVLKRWTLINTIAKATTETLPGAITTRAPEATDVDGIAWPSSTSRLRIPRRSDLVESLVERGHLRL